MTALFAADDPQATFKSLFGDQIKQVQATVDTKDDAELGAKLLEAGRSVSDSRGLQILLFEKAYEFAAKDPSGLETAVEAMKQLATADPARAAQCEQKTLDAYQGQYARAKGEEKSAAAKLYYERLITLADERQADKKYDDAEKLYRSAIPIAAAAGRAGGNDDPAAKIKALQAVRDSAKKYDALVLRFNQNPTDAVAARQLAQHCLIEAQDFPAAAKYAPRAGDESFAKLVVLAGKEPASLENAQDAADLGELFKKLAETATPGAKPAALLRAKIYYAQFLALHPAKDAARLKAELAMSQIDKAVGASTSAAGGSSVRSTPGAAIKFNLKDLPSYGKMTISPKWERAKAKTTLNSQTIKEPFFLTREQSPYLINGVIIVDAGATLEIAPGTTVLFAPDAKLHIKGTLRMTSEDDWIVLAPAQRQRKWEGVYSEGKVTASRCLVIGAKTGIVTRGRDSLQATFSIFTGNDVGISVLDKTNDGRGNFTVEDSLFYRNDIGVYAKGGRVEFARCFFLANAKHGIFAESYSGASGTESTFAQNGMGIETKSYDCHVKMRQSNLLNAPAQAVNGSESMDLRENFWGKEAAAQLTAGKSPGVTGKSETIDWLKEPVQTAFPALPKCEYLLER